MAGATTPAPQQRRGLLEQQQQPQRQQRQQQGHQQQQQRQQQAGLSAAAALPIAALAAAAAACACPPGAGALEVLAEPSNALSLPTWAIHVSSVAEWVLAIALFWRYAEVSGNPRWKGMSWAMLPALGSAMSACTWHFFYNSPELDFLVALQAFLTVVGNFTCWVAAYRIYAAAKA